MLCSCPRVQYAGAQAEELARSTEEERMPSFRMTAWSVAAALFMPLASAQAHGPRCARIQDGTIVKTTGEPITLGFDEWGYTYQARLVWGSSCDAAYDAAWCQQSDAGLVMTWNDAWLSNRDCDGDGLLDRHYGFPSYRGSDARLTNTLTGSYELDGRRCPWLERTLIVAAPVDAQLIDDVWYDAQGDELGSLIWSEFIVVRERLYDPCGSTGSSADGGRRGWRDIVFSD
jgi:hypothetical protein